MAFDKYLNTIAVLATSGTFPPLELLALAENPTGNKLLGRAPLPLVESEKDESPATLNEDELARLEKALDLTNMEYEEVKEVVSEWADYMAHKENTQKEDMANDDYFDMITLLGISGTSPPRDLLELGESEDGDKGIKNVSQMIKRSLGLNPRPPYIPIESPPFFITVKLSEKGKKAGVEEREDGLYLGDVKISDREILVK